MTIACSKSVNSRRGRGTTISFKTLDYFTVVVALSNSLYPDALWLAHVCIGKMTYENEVSVYSVINDC